MIVALAAFAVLSQSPQSLLREVVPNPTGRNGYEEYLMACDVVRNTRVGLILTTPAELQAVVADYERPRTREDELNEKTAKPNDEYYSAAKKYQNFTLLQLRREAVRIAGAALDYLAKGNRKPVFDPRTELNWRTTFPEYGEMRVLARLAAAGAYVAYADGQPAKGNQNLLDIFQLGHNLSRGVLIARLVGVSVHSIAFSTYEKLIPAMTQNDAEKVVAMVPKWVTNPPAAVACLDAEFKFIQQNFAKMLEDPEGSMAMVFNGPKRTNAQATAAEFLGKMTEADAQRILKICQDRMDKNRERLVTAYSKPESEWDVPVELDEDPYPEYKAVRSAEDFGQFVAGNLTPAFAQVGSVEVRNRTQFRLLRLSAAVVRYKWEHDKFPSTLAEAVGEENLADPASGDKFHYEVQGSGFKVWSKGTPRTGEIGLRYVRPQQGRDGPPPPRQ